MADVQAGRAQGKVHVRVNMIVNGSVRALTVEPRTTLLDALREELALTGPKKSCDRGECGGVHCPYRGPPGSVLHDPGGDA